MRQLDCFGLVVVLAIAGCSGPPPSTAPVRLVDVFADATIEGTPTGGGVQYGPTEWSFEDDPSDWRAGQGIDAFRVDEGSLHGRATSEQPALVVERHGDIPETEMLYAVEVRARVSAGTRMEVRFDPGPELVLPRALGNPVSAFSTPIHAGDELQTYLIRATSKRSPADMKYVILVPTTRVELSSRSNRFGPSFEGEHVDSIASGVGWHGMAEVYSEAIVTRAPERIRYQLELPENPFFELSVATSVAAPLTFRAEFGDRVVETTIEEPDHWNPVTLDLDGLGGTRVDVTLSLDGDAGNLGFWGNAAIRSRTARGEAPQAVVLILTDTLRADHVQLNGYERETMPHLARRAGEGVWFEDVISQATWTKVSVPAIQTSLYPTTHTVADVPDRLPASAPTLAEAFRAAGYATLSLNSYPFVGQLTNLHQGYEVMHESGALDQTNKTADPLVERLLPWMDAHRDTPFFVFLHVVDAHAPFRPDTDHETAFSDSGEMDALETMIDDVRPHIENPTMQMFGMPTRSALHAAGVDAEEFVRREVDGMDSSIRGMDDALARVFDKLAELGLSDRALVALVADHGTELLEHDDHFHGHSLYGELNRVPMMLWGPRYVPGGRRVRAMVQTIDLMPTILELSGLETPSTLQGQSLTALFDDSGEAGWTRPAFTELRPSPRSETAGQSVISDGFKLIELTEGDTVRRELYDHREDPLNLEEIGADHPEVVARLTELLANWSGFVEAARLEEMAPAELDSAELERLRSLGYLR